MRSVFKKKAMKHTLFQSLVLSLLFFATVPAAADITHNFQSMTSEKKLTNIGSTTRSEDDGIIYSRTGANTYFGNDVQHKGGGVGAVIALNLFTQYGYVTTSPALSNLSSITINHAVATGNTNKLNGRVTVSLSTDNSDWTSITPTVVYNTGNIVVTAPSPGAYYVKIYNSSTWEVSITQITYTLSDCNCFTYTPE